MSFSGQKLKRLLSLALPLTALASACNPLGVTEFAENFGGVATTAVPGASPSATLTPFSASLDFDVGAEASYSFDPARLALSGGSCRLKEAADQTDDDSDSTSGFGAGAAAGALWDNTLHSLVLDRTVANGAQKSDSELSVNWTPRYAALVNYLKLNGSGSVSSGNSIAATVGAAGAASNGDSSGFKYETGKLNQGLTFDGNDDIVTLGNPGLSGATTISFWMNVAGYGSSGISFPFVKEGDYRFVLYSTGLDFVVHTSNTAWYGAGTTATAAWSATQIDQWHHVAGTYDGQTVKIYLDGVLQGQGSQAISGTITNNSHAVYLAQDDVGTYNRFRGTLDEVAIWSQALTASEIQTIYEHQQAPHRGVYTSRVMDGGAAGATWTTLSWKTPLPFWKPLTGYSSGSLQNESSADYPALVGSAGTIGGNNLLSGLTALWHFNEAANTSGADSVKDASGQGRDGTPSSASIAGQPGLFHSAAQFNGTSDLIDVNDPMNLPAGDFSLSTWVYIKRGQSAQAGILGNANSTYSRYFLTVYGGDTVNFFFQQSDTNQWSVGSAVPVHQWANITVTRQGTNLNLYVNGQLGATTSSVGTLATNSTGHLNIGRDPYSWHPGSIWYPDYFKGSVDELAMWSRALHPTEIAQLYRRGANRVKVQVRTCTTSDCSDDPSGTNWKGADGTSASVIGEIHNHTTPLTGLGSAKAVAPSFAISSWAGFSSYADTTASHRYFQYRTILESDDVGTGCVQGGSSTWCSPEVTSIQVGPNRYAAEAPVAGKTGTPFKKLLTFQETLGSSCSQGVKYALGLGSTEAAATYYWWDSAARSGAGGWVPSNGSAAQANSAATTQAHLADFSTQVGVGTAFVKAILQSSSTTACELDQVVLTGER